MAYRQYMLSLYHQLYSGFQIINPKELSMPVVEITVAGELSEEQSAKIVEEPLDEALITVDTKTVYRVTSDIPNMIPSEGISISDEDLVSKP